MEASMRKHRFLATSVGLALLLTTAASTTYAQSYTPQGGPQSNGLCHWIPWLPWCHPGGGGGGGGGGFPPPSATPELDSLMLFGIGLSGLGGYAVNRYRARRRG
jgi:hypothetical protein